MRHRHTFSYILPILIGGLFACSGKKAETPEESGKQENVFSVNSNYKLPAGFDLQGHRIARGLASENSLFAIPFALEIPELTTLEMDVCITKDKKVIISHEPWMSSENCDHPNDDRVMAYEEEKIRLYDMTYEMIREYRCGGHYNPRFPKQRIKYEKKPLLDSMIIAVKKYCESNDRPLPRFSIEIKSNEDWDNFYTPVPDEFARLVVEVITRNGILDNVLIQSFDPRSLEAVHRINPDIPLALLSNAGADWEADRKKLSFTPAVYSPEYKGVNAKLAEAVHASGVKLVPYTVNDSLSIVKVIESGSDGIISDYPNTVVNIMKLYRK